LLSFVRGACAPSPRLSCAPRRSRLGLFLACTALSAPLHAGLPTVAAAAQGTRKAPAAAPFQDPTIVAAAGEGVVVVSPDDVYILEQRVVTSGDNSPALSGRSTGGGVIIISGEAGTSGENSTGIFAEANGQGRDAYVNAGTVITSGAESSGIVVRATDGFTADSPYGPLAYGNAVTTSQSVTTSGANAVGISAVSNGGAALVTANAVATSGDGAVGIEAQGDAFASVTSTTVTTSGSGATGISAQSAEGGVVVASGSVATTGAAAAGIVAKGQGNVTVTSGSVETSGDPAGEETPAAVGIIASSAAGNVVVESGSIRTGGEDATGIQAYAYNGISITSEQIVATGNGAGGIDAGTVLGAITVDSGTVDVTGDLASGINVVSKQGRVDITSDAVTTAGDFSSGIKVIPGGTATVTSGTVDTSGDYSMGIEIFSTDGDVTVASGAITTDGIRSSGISAVALSSGGDIDISADSVATRGFSSDAIYANAGSSLTVKAGSLSTHGDESTGVFATAYDSIDIAADSIVTKGDLSAGVSAESAGGSVAIEVGSVSTSGDSSVGVYAGGLTDVTIKAGSVVTSGDRLVRTDPVTGEVTYFDSPAAIAAYSYSGDIVVTADNVGTSGYAANGITTYSVLGTSTVTVANVTTAGGRSGGVRARGGTGATVIADVVQTHGYGIDAGAVTGEVLIKANQVTTTGSAYAQGIELVSIFGSGRIESGTISTVGRRSSGINLLIGGQPGYAGDGVVISGDITTQGDDSDGIRAEVYVGSATIESGSIETAGFDASGIDVLAGGNVTVKSGSVTTSGTISDGIKAVSQLSPFGGTPGNVSITSGSVSVSGDSARGIVGLAQGDVAIVSGSVATIGGTAILETLELVPDENGYYNYEIVRRPGPRPVGILGESTGGSVTITSSEVTTRSREAHGIHALTGTGAIDVATGDIRVTGTNANAIRAESYSGDIEINIGGDVSAARGPSVEAITGGALNLTIAKGGLLRAGRGQFAVSADAASADLLVQAGGTLRGPVSLTRGDDLLEVNGLFDALGASRFGDGEDLLVNNGTVSATSGTVLLNGLENFTNRGLVTLADGEANDMLYLSGTAFEGGTGSAVRFDVVAASGGAATADRLILGDVSGVTRVQVAMRGAVTLDTRADLISVGGASPDGAFVLDPASADAGFLRYRLLGVGTATISLATAPGREIFEAARIAPAATNLWRRGADAWAAHRMSGRDIGEATAGRGLWGQFFTGDQKIDGLNYGAQFDGDAYSEAVTAKEKYSGFQLGGDLLSGPVRVGVTAGYGDNDVRLNASGNRIEAKGFNLGVYGGWIGGPWFVDVLGKVDFPEIAFHAGSAGVRRNVDATIFGVRADAGLRLGGERFFAEPMVSLSWTKASLDDFDVPEGNFRLDDGAGLLGQAGIRGGGKWALGGGYTLSPSAGLFAVKELGGDGGLRFRSGGGTLEVDGDLPGTFARAEGGLSLSGSGGWDVYLRGQGDFGGDVSGAAVRAGFNWRW
jgi:hypothetical protein